MARTYGVRGDAANQMQPAGLGTVLCWGNKVGALGSSLKLSLLFLGHDTPTAEGADTFQTIS